MKLARLRDRSIILVKHALLGLLAKSGYKLSKASSPTPSRANQLYATSSPTPSRASHLSAASSPGPSSVNLEKRELIDYTFSKCRPRPTSFADLGGVWGVDGVYTFYALENYRTQSAFLADDKFTAEVVDKAAGHPQLELLEGNFGTDTIATRVRGADAIFLFDVLLHQVSPDWDQILAKYARTAKYLVVFNQQWTGEKTVRLLDLGRDEYLRNTPHEATHPTVQALFEKMHERHLEHDRPWRDIYNVWQWGITDADLIAKAEALGFRMQYYKNCGRFGRLPNFENHAFVFRRADLPDHYPVRPGCAA